MHTIAEKIYPGRSDAFATIIYARITCNELNDEVRLKVDENVRRMLTRDTLRVWREYER